MIYGFGPFSLDVVAGILFRDAEPTDLGERAVVLLKSLIEAAGAPVSKETLIETAWPGLAIEDSNLTVQIAAMRKVLATVSEGSGWIQTLPRRGYRYAGPKVETKARGADANPKKPIHKASIAVLPFANLSSDPSNEYFADGMVDDIITGLSRCKELFVVARSSSFTYKGRPQDVKQIGQELGVRYVLEGSIRRDQNRIRINGQMIEAESGASVWARHFDRNLGDVFALQDEMAAAVVGAIAPGLRQAEVERVKRKRRESLDAYDLVLRAQPDVFSGMPDRATLALEFLHRALSAEPAYALAHAFAAMCHHNRFLRAGLQEAERSASIHHANLAIEHGQDDALALAFAGFSIGMDAHDRTAASACFERALSISPSTALIYILGSVILGWSGDADRAIEWGRRGLHLSPLDPWAFAAFHSIMLGHFRRGEYEQSMIAAHKAVQSNPGHSISHMLLAAPLMKLNRVAEAKAAAARVLELQPRFRYGQQFSGVACEPTLSAQLAEALDAAGLLL